MRGGSISEGTKSRRTYEMLEAIVREKVQDFIRDSLKKESEFFGQEKSERTVPVDEMLGYRNGYGKSWKLSFQSGTITIP